MQISDSRLIEMHALPDGIPCQQTNVKTSFSVNLVELMDVKTLTHRHSFWAKENRIENHIERRR